MQEIAVDLCRSELTGKFAIAAISEFPQAGEICVVLRVKAAEIQRTIGLTRIASNVPQPDDFARALDPAKQMHAAVTDGERIETLVLPGIKVSIDDRVTGLGLPAGGEPRKLQLSVPFITVPSDLLAMLSSHAAAQNCRIAEVRIETGGEAGQGAATATSAPCLTAEDLSSLALWLDGIAKFIDITKARLPNLDTGRTLMMQRLFRHTMALKKRVQDLGAREGGPTSDSTPRVDQANATQ